EEQSQHRVAVQLSLDDQRAAAFIRVHRRVGEALSGDVSGTVVVVRLELPVPIEPPLPGHRAVLHADVPPLGRAHLLAPSPIAQAVTGGETGVEGGPGDRGALADVGGDALPGVFSR